MSRMRASAPHVCTTPPAAPFAAVCVRERGECSRLLQSVQTPFRCVRRVSVSTRSCDSSAEPCSCHPPRCQCALGDAGDRDNVLTTRDRTSREEGKDHRLPPSIFASKKYTIKENASVYIHIYLYIYIYIFPRYYIISLIPRYRLSARVLTVYEKIIYCQTYIYIYVYTEKIVLKCILYKSS